MQQLRKHFNYSSFQTGQKEIIESVLSKRDVLGVLPTGSGKSLCYQFLAKVLPGTTIVVSPLISLMIDQVKELKAQQFKSVIALNSFMTYEERSQAYHNLSQYKLIYVSPELLQHQSLLNRLKQLNVKLFVVDEAHCITQWGHEFRPDYLRLVHVIDHLDNPPVLALTATASKPIQEGILSALKRPNMQKHIYPIDRPNIAFHVQEISNHNDKINYIVRLLLEYRVPTLIYFTSRLMTEKVSNELAKHLKHIRVSHYHGGMNRVDRTMIQQQFMNDQLDVICCTSAFGMGINKQNIRLIIHYHFPSEIGSYIQEVGRAGRDGLKSVGLVLYSHNDRRIHEYLIQSEFPSTVKLHNLCYYLSRVSEHNSNLQNHKEQLLTIIDHNETHWDFLHFQLEKYGVLQSNQIVAHQIQSKQVYERIVKHIQTRRRVKLSKLADMVNWLEEDTCLRHNLYTRFQSSYKKPMICCRHCGDIFTNWNPDESKRVIREQEMNWQDQLKQLFFIGAYDESRAND